MCSQVLLEEFKYFKENMDELFKLYPFKVIVIKNKQVIGVYSSTIEAVKETSKKEPLGTFLVQECDVDPSAYTVQFYNPRVVLN